MKRDKLRIGVVTAVLAMMIAGGVLTWQQDEKNSMKNQADSGKVAQLSEEQNQENVDPTEETAGDAEGERQIEEKAREIEQLQKDETGCEEEAVGENLTAKNTGEEQETSVTENTEKGQETSAIGNTEKEQETSATENTEKGQETSAIGNTEKEQETSAIGNTEKEQETSAIGNTEKEQETSATGNIENEQAEMPVNGEAGTASQESTVETAGTVQDLMFNEETVMELPVSGSVLIPYNMENTVYFPTLDLYQCSPGVVFSAAEGTPVLAAADGEVVSVENNARTGLTVTMNLGNGYEAVYGQLTDVSLEAGQKVQKSARIGAVAAPTKYYRKEGSNLFFEMKKDGKAIDPMVYLPALSE